MDRRKWTSTIATFIDGVSMIPPDQFLQCDVRMWQAKMNAAQPFGGLAVNICGDSLQLPPVDNDGTRKSLAMPHNNQQPSEAIVEDADDPAAKEGKAANAEGLQGYMLWQSIRRVV